MAPEFVSARDRTKKPIDAVDAISHRKLAGNVHAANWIPHCRPPKLPALLARKEHAQQLENKDQKEQKQNESYSDGEGPQEMVEHART